MAILLRRNSRKLLQIVKISNLAINLLIYLKYIDFNYKLENFVENCRYGQKVSPSTLYTTHAYSGLELVASQWSDRYSLHARGLTQLSAAMLSLVWRFQSLRACRITECQCGIFGYSCSTQKAKKLLLQTDDEMQNSQFLIKSHYFNGYKLWEFLASHLPVVCL